jgi:hypothetical protein
MIEVGTQCKRLLDAGRLAFLRERGFHATLRVSPTPPALLPPQSLTGWPRRAPAMQEYIPRSVTTENTLLVAAAPAATGSPRAHADPHASPPSTSVCV